MSQNYEEAVKWYRKAAEQGLLDAQFNLSEMYRKGLGVPKDNVKSTEWLDKALKTDKQAVWLRQCLVDVTERSYKIKDNPFCSP